MYFVPQLDQNATVIRAQMMTMKPTMTSRLWSSDSSLLLLIASARYFIQAHVFNLIQ